MGKQVIRVWDSEVAECFELFGGEKTALYFETLRYRQQLRKGEYFLLSTSDIKNKTGLSLESQRTARKVLAGTGWIEALRHRLPEGGTGYAFRLKELAYEATKRTVRRRNIHGLKQKFVNSFSQNNNKNMLSTVFPNVR